MFQSKPGEQLGISKRRDIRQQAILAMGNTSHQAYLNAQNNKEFFAIDVWDNLESIQKLYSDPNLAAEFGRLFEGQPEVTVWADAGWLQF